MKVLFTGGGSAGHVTPNLALIARLQQSGNEVVYVGSALGIERELVEREGVRYLAIRSGKLRRYFSWQNFVDPLNVLVGFFQAFLIMRRERPHVVFSKGGFVSVPVIVAAWLARIPAISHESDIVPGLANRLCAPFCRIVCVNFNETLAYVHHKDARVTGTPLREGLTRGDASAARVLLEVMPTTPVVLVFGGSLGARRINAVVREALPELLKVAFVVHVCGAGAVDTSLNGLPGYRQFEYVHDNFGDLLALADVVVARAGANTIYELLYLRKPHILVPLPATSSRGDQLVNAQVMAAQGFSVVIDDDALDASTLIDAVRDVNQRREEILSALEAFTRVDSVDVVCNILSRTARP